MCFQLVGIPLSLFLVSWKRLTKWLENSPELYFSHFNVLPLDERSLIGSKKLVSIWITSRYTGISDKSLRGIHIVVFLGDDVRLPPVLDNLVYHSNNKSKETYKESSASRTFNQLLHLKQLFVKGDLRKSSPIYANVKLQNLRQ